MAEVEVGLNTAQSGEVDFLTNKLSGKLKAILVDAPESVKMKIEFGNFILLDLAEFVGNEYFAIRKYAVNEKNERINYSATEWVINDKIHIIIEGRKNANVNIKFILE